MTTEKQIPGRKDISAGSAIADIAVSPNESREGFDALLKLHVEKFNPADAVEMSMIEDMCACYWRIRRIWAVQAEIMAPANASRRPSSDRQLARLQRDEACLHAMYQRAVKTLFTIRKVTGAGPAGRISKRTQAPAPSTCLGLPNEPKLSRCPLALPAKRTQASRRPLALRTKRTQSARSTFGTESPTSGHLKFHPIRPNP